MQHSAAQSPISKQTPLKDGQSRRQKPRHRQVKIPKNQAKVVSDQEMQLLEVEAASKVFYECVFSSSAAVHQKVRTEDMSYAQIMATQCKGKLNIFEGELIYSEIQVYKFISLFMACFEVGTEVIIASLVYIDRLIAQNKDLYITESTAKSILHTALTLASKFYLDRYEKNTIFYAVGGLSKRQMRSMQDLYLDLIDFNLYIDESEYNRYMSKIKTMIAYKYHQTGQIVILERNLRKRSSGVNTFNEKLDKQVEKIDTHQLRKQMTSSNLDDDEPVSANSLTNDRAKRSDSQSTKSTNPSIQDASDSKSDYDISSQGSSSSSKKYNFSHASQKQVSPFNMNLELSSQYQPPLTERSQLPKQEKVLYAPPKVKIPKKKSYTQITKQLQYLQTLTQVNPYLQVFVKYLREIEEVTHHLTGNQGRYWQRIHLALASYSLQWLLSLDVAKLMLRPYLPSELVSRNGSMATFSNIQLIQKQQQVAKVRCSCTQKLTELKLVNNCNQTIYKLLPLKYRNENYSFLANTQQEINLQISVNNPVQGSYIKIVSDFYCSGQQSSSLINIYKMPPLI
eukprot:403363375